MLFWISLAILVGGIIWAIVERDSYNDMYLVPIILGVFSVFSCLIVLGVNHIDVNGDIARINVERESLVYQYENDIYDNDNDLGKKELMDDIREYNSRLATMKERQDDFWVGIFIPNIYDQFEFIELE